MIPIKIQCGCGQKYSFEVEPVRGCIAYAVACPVCGAEGTAAANAAIANHEGVAADLKLRIDRHGSAPTAFTRQTPVANRQGTINRRGRVRSKWLAPAIGVSIVLVVTLAGVVYAAHSHGQKLAAGHSDPSGNEYPRTLAQLNAWYGGPKRRDLLHSRIECAPVWQWRKSASGV